MIGGRLRQEIEDGEGNAEVLRRILPTDAESGVENGWVRWGS